MSLLSGLINGHNVLTLLSDVATFGGCYFRNVTAMYLFCLWVIGNHVRRIHFRLRMIIIIT